MRDRAHRPPVLPTAPLPSTPGHEVVGSDGLLDLQHGYRLGRIGVWELVVAERAHFDSQPTIEPSTVLTRGSVAVDRAGDAWRFGTTRWTCLAPVDGDRIKTVARLTQGELIRGYGPVRLIGSRRVWRYETIRGRS